MSAGAQERATKRLTHQDRVLLMLNDAGPAGVTTEQLLTVHHRFSASIFELRKKGWNIETKDRAGTDCATFVLHPDLKPVRQPDLVAQVPPALPSAPPVTGLCECGHVKGVHRFSTGDCLHCGCQRFKDPGSETPSLF